MMTKRRLELILLKHAEIRTLIGNGYKPYIYLYFALRFFTLAPCKIQLLIFREI